MGEIEAKWRRRDQANLVGQPVIGRPITRVEALRIVRQILEQAERERLEFAEFEAMRGLSDADVEELEIEDSSESGLP